MTTFFGIWMIGFMFVMGMIVEDCQDENFWSLAGVFLFSLLLWPFFLGIYTSSVLSKKEAGGKYENNKTKC